MKTNRLQIAGKVSHTDERKPYAVKDADGATHIIIATRVCYIAGEMITFYVGGEVVARFNHYKSFRRLPPESVPNEFLDARQS